MKKYNVKVNGITYAVEIEEVLGSTNYNQTIEPIQAAAAPKPAPAQQPVISAPNVSTGAITGDSITAPMPGTILEIKVSEGQTVKTGEVLIILEAMKMENEIVSPKDGTIAGINTSKGSSVNTGEVLISIN